MQHTDTIPPDSTWFRCQVGECRSKFYTKDDLRSHVRFFHWQVGLILPRNYELSESFSQTTLKHGEGAVATGKRDSKGIGKVLTSEL